MAQTIKQALNEARQLSGVSSTPELDVALLLGHVLQQNRSFLYTWPEKKLSNSEACRFFTLLEKRLAGEPIAYLIGTREFWSLSLVVSTATLIPRSETELLVEIALSLFSDKSGLQLLDLGTGSGAIALAIANDRPHWRLTATESSSAALRIAKLNAANHQLTNVSFEEANWFQGLTRQKFNLILSNPPYIAPGDPHLSQGDVRYEPLSALVAGEGGLGALQQIISGAAEFLEDSGWLLVEHGYSQGEAVRSLFNEAAFGAIQTRQDLAGQDRVTLGQKP